jgi:1,4-dihydroxy-2-naphthoyl-CoA synthase
MERLRASATLTVAPASVANSTPTRRLGDAGSSQNASLGETSDVSGYTEIVDEERGHLGVITLDRPDARDALTHTTYAELADAVETTAARCLVVTGADPAFCSGDDVKQIVANVGDKREPNYVGRRALEPAMIRT